MTRRLAISKQGFIALAMSGLLVSCSTMAFAQHRTGGGGRDASSGGRSSGGDHGGGGGSSNGGRSGGGQPSRGEHTGSTRDGESGQASGHAVPRSAAPASTSNPSGAAAAGATKESSRDSSPSESGNDRSRDSRPVVGHAVERPPYYSGGGSTVIVTRGYGSYYPWGYGGLGFGGYNGYYDPWWDPYPAVYAGGYGFGDEGALRLKVKPRDASVYVDGYFAGQVDDFDGVFQKLKIEPGPHRVEIHMDGYEPLTFEVRIMPDRKTTYRGEMKELP